MSARSTHVVYTFDDMTWAAAQARGMCFPQDQLVLALLEDPEVERLLVCDRPRSAPVKLAKDLIQRPVKFEPTPRARLRQPLRLRRQDPTDVAGLERAYATYDRRLRRAAARFGMERPAIVTSQPLLAGFAALEWAGPVTLYASDDLAAHPDYEPWHASIHVAYERVAERGRRVAAVSNALIERIAPRGPAVVVPNGVDPEIWLAPDPAPPWFTDLPGPRLLYVGSLTTRIDVDAVREVARALPEASIALVGPLADPAHFEPLRAEPNVSFHEPVGRRGVASLACAADACLLPHVRSPLTEAMSPLKLYEYLASGRPVVATDLEPVRRVDGPVIRVPAGGDFSAGVRAALAAGPVAEAARRDSLAANSWARRSATVVELALEPNPQLEPQT